MSLLSWKNGFDDVYLHELKRETRRKLIKQAGVTMSEFQENIAQEAYGYLKPEFLNFTSRSNFMNEQPVPHVAQVHW